MGQGPRGVNVPFEYQIFNAAVTVSFVAAVTTTDTWPTELVVASWAVNHPLMPCFSDEAIDGESGRVGPVTRSILAIRRDDRLDFESACRTASSISVADRNRSCAA